MLQKVVVADLGIDFGQLSASFLGPVFWKWYDSHQNDVVLQVKFLFFKIDVQVYELRKLFEKFFGAYIV